MSPKLLAAVLAAAACLQAGCQPSSDEKAVSKAVLHPDVNHHLIPESGTELKYTQSLLENSLVGSKESSHSEIWKWETKGPEIVLSKRTELGQTSKAVYDAQWSLSQKEFDGEAISPWLPIIISGSQSNPSGGFVGRRLDGTVGPFSSESSYKGTERIMVSGRPYACHIIKTHQVYKSGGIEFQLNRTAWWSRGIGIVKQVDRVEAQGLKRELTLVLSPK